ncbi:MAG: DMT family transporter, partial [Methyloceanibacter sp.]
MAYIAQTADRSQRLKAIGLMVAAIVSFSVLDATAKYLVGTVSLPVAEVVWLRFAFHVLFSLIVLWPFAFTPSLKSKRPGHQILRSLFMLGSTGFNFVALKYLQLDETITIFFLTPLLVAGLAGPLLGEWPGWHRLMAIAVGFLGVLIVMQPGFGAMHWAALWALAATLSYALYNLSTRYLAAYDPPEVTQTYSPLAGLLLTMPFALLAWQWPADIWTWSLLASLGLWGGLGHWLLILAHRHAPAPVLAPFVYVGLISMSVLGFLVFDDVPTLATLAGGAIVILSGLYVFERERRAMGAAKA